MNAALAVRDLVAGYGPTIILDGVSFDVPENGTLAILGRNGVGKTTLLTTLMGLTTRHRGAIELQGRAIETKATHLRSRAGLALVAQERRIFPSLSVHENLLISVQSGGWSVDQVYSLFPASA